MKPYRNIIIIGMLMLTLPVLHAQNIDYLGKAKDFLAQGDCERARYAYEDYKKTHPSGDADVERLIAECGKTHHPSTVTKQDLTFTLTNGLSFKMVFVQGGTFQMGSYSGEYDAKPVHNVTLSDYYMGETEVTQALWKAVIGYNNPTHWKGDQLPMETVSWTDCQEFVERLNSLLTTQLPQGYRFALPSEAQWEYAARGGQKSSGSMYAGSGNVDFVAWYTDNSSNRTHDVKQKAPNELGLYDMSGNVWEWCEDWYSSSFYSDNRNWTDPVNTYVGSDRVLRGGSWGSHASSCRVAGRNYAGPSYRGDSSGFRLALVRRKD